MKERTILAMLLLLVGVSMAQKSPLTHVEKTPRATPRIEIELVPEVHGASQPEYEMLIFDPHQHKTGVDNNRDNGKPWREVPKSTYEGSPNRVITVYDPAEGEYWLGIYGKSDGVYRLAVRDSAGTMEPSFYLPSERHCRV